MTSLEQRIKAQAYGLGFDLVGITSLGEVESAPHFDAWLARGYDGEMHYLSRWASKRRDTRAPHPGAESAIVVALDYGGREPAGPVARYARGDDYHDVMRQRLRELLRWLERETGRAIAGRPYVDTGPVLERDLAQRAGLGWFGKNTNLINPRIGSFFFIGALFVPLALVPDDPFTADRCGTCTKCIDACPTAAITAPRTLDATRCISYLTIELRGSIPRELRPDLGDMVYGCDICQDVCPWNERFAQPVRDPAFSPRQAVGRKDAVTLARELLAMSDEQYRDAFADSAMTRAKLAGLKRNAAVVLGNVGSAADIPVLSAAVEDAEPMVREHAAWALERLGAVAGPTGR